MPTYTIQAYQEMYAEVKITAEEPHEALDQFKILMSAGKIHWLPSDEDLDVEVQDEGDQVVLTSD